MDPRTPVLVGVGAVTRHDDDGTRPDADGLAAEALDRALADAGDPTLRRRIGLVVVPRGTWPAHDLGHALVADARTISGEIGVLQQTLVTRACQAVADGHVDVAVVVGAEARHRARVTGLPECAGPDTEPDEVIRPESEIITRTEVERGLATPANQYAIVESAIRHAAGRSPGDHVRHLAELWSAFGRVAAGNPDAWDRSAPTADVIAGDRIVAPPYTRRMCSQWNVDQAAALVLASADAASGVARDRWVFPVAAAECNEVVPLPQRAELHRWPAFRAVAQRVLDGREPGLVDLYSCFPSAVQVQAAELGLPLDPAPTVTGGMTFAGGPFNSYLLHATATMAGLLRERPASSGLVTNVSGMLSKPAAAVWSATPAAFRCDDVRIEAPTVPLAPDVTGAGTVVGITAVGQHGIAVVDVDGVRTLASCDDPAVDVAGSEWVGRDVQVVEPGRFQGGM